MLTPQNFKEKTFERAVFGGYDMGAVDDFLEEAANDYAAVAKENMVLKSKMKVLVDKIEEYRATEDSMRLTLLSAQKLCSQMEQETKEKAETILAEARLEAEQITREAHNQRISEEARFLEAKKESTKYIENMRLACAKQLEFLEQLNGFKIDLPVAEPAPRPARGGDVEDAVRSIENSVSRLDAAIADSDKEIGRVVQDGADLPSMAGGEPTRMFPGTSADPNQVSIENLRFGK